MLAGSVPTIGQNVQRLREAADLSRRDLAIRMGLQQGSSTVADLEHDRTQNLSLERLCRIASALEVTLTDILDGVTLPFNVPLSADPSRHTMRLKTPSGGSHGDVVDSARLLKRQKKHAQMLGAISEAAGRIVGLVSSLAENTDTHSGQTGSGKTTRKVR